MPVNPIVTDPNLTIQFPGVTESEMRKWLVEAEQQGAKVVEPTPGDISLVDITYKQFFWSVECLCFWNQAIGLTVQISNAKYRNIVQTQISAALAKIRTNG